MENLPPLHLGIVAIEIGGLLVAFNYSGQIYFHIYIYIYIYCHQQTDCFVVSQLFSVARHVGRLKLGSKPAQIYVKLSIIPLSQLA